MSVQPFGQNVNDVKNVSDGKNVSDVNEEDNDNVNVQEDIERDVCQYCKETIDVCRCDDDDRDDHESREASQNEKFDDYFEDEDPDYLTDLRYRKTEEMY